MAYQIPNDTMSLYAELVSTNVSRESCMAKSQLDKTLTALAGEYLVAGHLCLKGYMASLTLKNYPKVDIFCLNPKTGKQISIQVKTIRHTGNAYYLPEKVSDLDCPFVFVHITKANNVEFFIVPCEDVEKLSTEERNSYLAARPTVRREQPRMLSLNKLEPYRDQWERLDLG
jgi:hypothetical protein